MGLLQIYRQEYRWKTIANRSVFDEAMNICGFLAFADHQVFGTSANISPLEQLNVCFRRDADRWQI